RAEAGWSTLSTRYEALAGVSHRIVQATVDGSPIYRLQAVAGDVKAAEALCSTLQSQGADCQVKD
ncbi:MAG TPA: SPOR domain-containing protein, partial [Croceibacterium sp.]|nr:SPOR domain-containing protein [Croceibacterium sp.]